MRLSSGVSASADVTDRAARVLGRLTKEAAGAYAQTAVGVANVTLFAADATAKSILVKNIGATNIFIGIGGTDPTTATGFRLKPDESLSLHDFQGIVEAIGDAAGGNVATIKTVDGT